MYISNWTPLQKNIVVTSYGGLQLSLSNMTKPILPSSLVRREDKLFQYTYSTKNFSRLCRSIKFKTKLKNLLSRIYARLQQVNTGTVIHFVSPVIFMIVAFTAIRHLHATIAVRDALLFQNCKCLYVFIITLFR